MDRDREFTELVLEGGELSIVIGSQGVHFLAGPRSGTPIPRQETAPLVKPADLPVIADKVAPG